MKRNFRFPVLAWGMLFYNIVVILWGAFVRATGSGAGCGAHWPLCNGVVVPRAPQIETIIEFIHRISSGLTLPLVIVLVVWAWRIYPHRHPIRWSSALVVGFTLSEALLGAGLVLFELVANNASVFRALAMVLHLVNTFLLLGALALTAWWASQGTPSGFGWNGVAGWLVTVGVLGMLILGASGAITALGDTLFPVGSLSEGIRQDFSATAHFLIRLRVFHPVIAVAVGLYLIFLVNWLKERIKDSRAGKLASLLVGLVVAQLLLGVTNLMLLAPVWTQLLHLLMTDLIWICLILFSALALTGGQFAGSASD